MLERFRKWVLVTGHRYSLASGILALMIGVVALPALSRFAIRNTTPLIYMASTLIGGNITLITVVVAINQVILSKELESPGSLRDEIERTADFRQSALDGQTPPTKPSEFLQQLLQQTRERAQSLEGRLPESAGEASERLLNDLSTQCRQVGEQLEPPPDKLSMVLFPLLGIDYVDYIHDCRECRSNYDDGSHDELLSTLDSLTSDLENLDVARQYFATAFVKEELSMLSRSLVYIGIIAVSLPIALLYQLATYSSASPPMPGLFAFSLLTVVVALMPIALLIAFILRIATVAEHIAGITPFKV